MKIAVIDDHYLLLDGLTMVLESISDDVEVSSYSSPAKALSDISDSMRYDIILSDIVMKEMNGLAFVSSLRRSGVDTPVLMISGVENLSRIKEILSVGANGFIHKSANSDELDQAIGQVLNGDYYLPDDAPPIWAYEKPDVNLRLAKDNIPSIPKLTEKQIVVLTMIGEGASNKEISNRLDISPNTVKWYLRTIFEMLNVSNRTACVNKAQILGLI